MTAEDYKNEANSKQRIPPKYTDFEDMDDIYWKQLDKSVVTYGSDVAGTFFDENCKVWNMNKLPSILCDVEKDYELVRNSRFFFSFLDFFFAEGSYWFLYNFISDFRWNYETILIFWNVEDHICLAYRRYGSICY